MEKKESQGSSNAALRHAFAQFSTNGAAVAVATAVTHPLDVLKVRLQMQLSGQRGPLVGMGEVLARIIRVEGPVALYMGLAPAFTRSVIYGGLRLSLYEPCKKLCSFMFGSTNVVVKVAAGAFSGAIATALTNPTEVLKVRLQMNLNSKSGPIKEIRKIILEEGIKALWKGVGPAMARAGALTASQLATYDESKQALLKRTPLEEGFLLHLISSGIAGSVGTLVTAPMDMVKTRLMLQRESQGVRIYRNSVHCAYQRFWLSLKLEPAGTTIFWRGQAVVVVKDKDSVEVNSMVIAREGFLALYKGGFATFARLGPQTAITFVVCEKLRELSGMKAF